MRLTVSITGILKCLLTKLEYKKYFVTFLKYAVISNHSVNMPAVGMARSVLKFSACIQEV